MRLFASDQEYVVLRRILDFFLRPHILYVSIFWVKLFFFADSASFDLVWLNCFSYLSFQMIFVFFFNSGRKGWPICNKFGIKLPN